MDDFYEEMENIFDDVNEDIQRNQFSEYIMNTEFEDRNDFNRTQEFYY
jgi:hypothetical protein